VTSDPRFDSPPLLEKPRTTWRVRSWDRHDFASRRTHLDVIPEHQLLWMGLEEDLPVQVVDFVSPSVMAD
jgi:hypothetical protein